MYTHTHIYITLNCKTSKGVYFGNILGIFKLKKALPYHLSSYEKFFKLILSKLSHLWSLENVWAPQVLFIVSSLVNFLCQKQLVNILLERYGLLCK